MSLCKQIGCGKREKKMHNRVQLKTKQKFKRV